MRVALDGHTVGRRQTGNERYVLELARELALRDDVDLLAYVDRGAEWPAAYAPAPRLAELRLRAPQLRIPLELPYRARRDRVDLLHVTYVGPPMPGVPLVTSVHDLSFEDQPELFSRPTRWRMQTLVPLTLRRSAAVIAISEFTRQRLIDVYDLPPERVHHVPVGVGSQWQPLSHRAAEIALRQYNLPRQFVLAVGTAHPRKNLPRVIEAVRMARAQFMPELELVLCGAFDPKDERLTGAIASADGSAWIRLLGYVSDDALCALYSTADVVAYASLYEGFGLPVLEAMACGAIVVASSTTAVAEAAGDAAFSVDPSDASQIAAGIRRASTDKELRRELRSRAPRHLAKFDWRVAATATVDVYRAALRLSR
jgi:glycosyltransferase involved in cell wall biosynthesis